MFENIGKKFRKKFTKIMSSVIHAYSPLWMDKNMDFSLIGTAQYPIPKFDQTYLMELTRQMMLCSIRDPSVLRLSGEFIIVGDLHGNIRDLLRIFAFTNTPINQNYLFLGDYVDRGDFSIEVITLLYALKVKYPSKIFLLRGNHEFEDVNTYYGFKEQCLSQYSIELYNEFNKSFSYMSIAAIVNNDTFLIHGGLSPLLKDLSILEQIQKPVGGSSNTDYITLISDLMWSDPTCDHLRYYPSRRGLGHLFGMDQVELFLRRNNLQRIIRAHQCIAEGVENFYNKIIFTVFSSSNYSPDLHNKSGIIKLSENDLNLYNFQPIPPLKRDEAAYNFQVINIREPQDLRSSSSNLERSVRIARRRSTDDAAGILLALQQQAHRPHSILSSSNNLLI